MQLRSYQYKITTEEANEEEATNGEKVTTEEDVTIDAHEKVK